MTDRELTRMPGERRGYALDGVGTRRFEGLTSRTAVAEAAAGRWRFGRRGFWRRRIEAVDAAGSQVGTYEPGGLKRGGRLFWAGRCYGLRPSSAWRERYVLLEGALELAVLDGKGWGSRPVKLHVDDAWNVEPGLLLFATFVVHGLAADANTAAATGATSAVSG